MRATSCAGILSALLALLVLAGCAGSPEPQLASGHHSRYQIGRPSYQVAPYQINGTWYYPKVDYSYDQTGTASWYGPGFDRQPTSDGEIYDMNGLTAAHKTLPLPSIVEVTNLQNGRAVRLRVNDRGPFVGDRLIDVSRRGAQLLGFEGGGTAPVRVRILRNESIQVAEAAMRGEYGPGVGTTAYASAAPAAAVATAEAAPRREPRTRTQLASAGPPSLRASEVIGSPPPEPAIPQASEIIAAPLPAAPAAAPPSMPHTLQPPAAPPPMAVAAASHRHWPSLIAEARADTLRPTMVSAAPSGLRPVPAVAKNSGRIFIQAGAFAVPENAQRVRAKIAHLGSVQVVPTASHGTALYQVRLGPLGSEAEAHRLLGRVVDSGYPGARVVAE